MGVSICPRANSCRAYSFYKVFTGDETNGNVLKRDERGHYNCRALEVARSTTSDKSIKCPGYLKSINKEILSEGGGLVWLMGGSTT